MKSFSSYVSYSCLHLLLFLSLSYSDTLEDTAAFITPKKIIATLAITSNPSGATIFINGARMGSTPYKASNFIPGYYDVLLRLKDYDDFVKEIHVDTAASDSVHIDLVSQFASAIIMTEPSGAKIFMNNDSACTSPCTLSYLKPGIKDFRAELQGYVSQTKSFSANKNSQGTLFFYLISQASLDSARLVAKEKTVLGSKIVLSVLSAISMGAGLYMNHQVSSQIDKERKARTAYSSAITTPTEYNRLYSIYEEESKKTDNLMRSRNTLYVIGFAFAAGFSLTFLF